MAPAQGTKRLADSDVKDIFACLFDQSKRPPDHLSFQIVPVGPNGLKLSPPSHEFEDGLYVLLRPQSKKKTVPVPEAPPHLRDLVLSTVPPENCAWSLSGPQFPVSNKAGALQQRYCYPKGRPEYSSFKGGALWTMRGPDGKEENEYRLLHVYRSQKRAANKGVTLAPSTTPLSCDYTIYQPIPKKPRYISPSRDQVLPMRYSNKSSPFPDGIHRINSTGTLSTALSFPTLDNTFSHSFESVQLGMPNNVHQPCPDQLTSHDSSGGHQGHPDKSPNRETVDHEFTFQDLHNDPLLQEMEQRSHEAKFLHRLNIVHNKVRQCILNQPQHMQAGLAHAYACWARSKAMDPLWAPPKPLESAEMYGEAFGQGHGHESRC